MSDQEEFPPGHPERRQVSNAMLAFQLTTLQESQTVQNALLREQMKDGFVDVRHLLDKHTEQISQIREQQVDQIARTKALEEYRITQEQIARQAGEHNALELLKARDGASSDAINRRLAVVVVTVLTLVIAALSAYAAFKG